MVRCKWSSREKKLEKKGLGYRGLVSSDSQGEYIGESTGVVSRKIG